MDSKVMNEYRLYFSSYMPDVRSLSVMASDIEDAIHRSKLILGKREVSDTLIKVEMLLPF